MSIQTWANAARQERYRQTMEHQQAISTIQGVLEDTIDSDSAARMIAKLYNPLIIRRPEVSPVATLWEIICEVARLLGGDSDLAGRLTNLLNSISMLPDVVDKHGKAVTPSWTSASTYWKDLPELAVMFREYAIEFEPVDETDDESNWETQAASLRNATNFGAKYLAEGRQPIGMSSHAEISLMQGIEVPCQTLEQKQRALLYVPLAATWMIIGGEKIYALCQYDQDRKDDAPGSTGAGDEWLWGKGRGYSMERWTFWRKRFTELVNTPGLKDDVRGFVEKAVVEMAQIEKMK